MKQAPLFRHGRLLSGLIALMLAMPAGESLGQAVRPEQTFFIRPQVGIASYVGDNNKSLFKFDDSFPYSAGLEVGYQFTVPFSLGIGYQLGNYPMIGYNADDDVNENDVRHSLELLLRYSFGTEVSPIAPYLQFGGHATFGNVHEEATAEEGSRTAFGPLVGLGLDVLLSERTSFFIEATTRAAFPDDAVDGDEDNGSGNFDLLSSLGLGLKINFGSGVVPVEVYSINGPSRLEVGQSGSYTASINEDATGPIEARWEWGDGTTGTGLSASHSYSQPGTYTVSFSAGNRKNTDMQSMTVTVAPRPVPASITTVSADPMNPDTRTAVRFSANVRGDTPLTYNWDFGDGESSTQQSPTHTFDEPGTYTVSLQVTNPSGTDTRTMNITVRRATSAICVNVTEMNTVYFNNNSSVLTSEGRAALRENLEILEECPEIAPLLEGYAGPGERNPQQLSEDRAQVVREFYMEGGIARNRITAAGRGRVTGMTTKKEGAERYRRVDSIPQ